MNALTVILLVLLFISGLLTGALVLMHSGKGTGVSDMIAASLYNASAGSGIWEKNLDRLTVITSVVFAACVIVMAVSFPTGTIGLAG
ncbi:MAG: preprotein translocase subunit SecG [Coriobacteriaceae bacterium]|nr:preprotein translocase subunit SecG [Coriobacteriaceae bacterium]